MSSKQLRKIVILGENYLWKVGHYHLESFQYSACVDQVVIYLDGFKNAPLKLHFRLEDNALLSEETRKQKWFMDWGCLMRDDTIINLNRPAVIRKLIEYYLTQNWNPREGNRPFEVMDALRLLEQIDLPVGMN